MLMEQQIARRLNGSLVILAQSSAQARKAIQHQKFDIAVVDFCLADCDGANLVRALHQADPDLAVIVVAQDISEQMTKEVFRCGCEELLIKDSSYYAVIPRMVSGLYRRRQLSRADHTNRVRAVNRRMTHDQTSEMNESLETILRTAENILMDADPTDGELTSRISEICRSARQLKAMCERSPQISESPSKLTLDKVLAGREELSFSVKSGK